MKTALILMLSLGAACFAADSKSNQEPTGEVKRLGSVNWNLETHKLTWVVQKGAMVNGEFVPASEQKYEISPDRAKMAVSEEERGFDGDEAVSLHRLLDVLAVYCAESVVWWDEGQGTPASKESPVDSSKPKTNSNDKDSKPAAKPSGEKPVRVGQPEPDRKPRYRVPDDHIVAMAAAAR
jgi:hypothetical protein